MSSLRIRALQAARPVAAKLAAAFSSGALVVTTKTNEHDVVSDWDHRAEDLLKDALAGEDAVFWGEETGHQPVTAPGQLQWLIDPIDGTSNFVHGYPMFSISIAAIRNEQVIAGVVVDPVTGNEYSADATGAYFNDAPLVSRPAPATPAQYNLVTSFPAAEILHRAPAQAPALFGELVTTFATVRRLVSGALELCLAARGIADLVLGVDTKPWDVAAGSYILTRAGGTYLTSTPASRDTTARLTNATGPAHLAPHYVAVAPGRTAEPIIDIFEQIQQM